ncbi:MAG: hypothetical protein L3J41_14270 [Melioribacteraceae bacterium]|nr:hypothetical protein [Melioribacteraceae bacterium]
MSIIKIKRKVKSSILKIRELEKFKGKNVEITIIECGEDKLNKNETSSLAGGLKSYGNLQLIEKEKNAWGIAVREKYENS